MTKEEARKLILERWADLQYRPAMEAYERKLLAKDPNWLRILEVAGVDSIYELGADVAFRVKSNGEVEMIPSDGSGSIPLEPQKE